MNSKLYLLNPGAVLLLLSFATACGSGSTAGGTPDGGHAAAGGAGGQAAVGGQTAVGGHAAAGGAGGQAAVGGLAAVDLGQAATYVILAMSGIDTATTSAVTGNLGVYPAAASYITGFSLTADSTNAFSTSTQVTGKVYAADYTAPTPSALNTAIGNMQTAFTYAAGRPAGVTELGAGDIGGKTLAAGVYKWGTGLLIPTDVTLSGSATDVWIFQIAQTLTMSSGTKVVLTGGALAKNVFWQVTGLVDFGTTAHCEGVVMTQTSVTLRTGASINGRLLAQTAVNLDGNTVVDPGI